jgi:thiamine-monophosphate kinase
MQENDFLEFVARQTPAHPRVPVNIGDDMAVVNLFEPAGAGAADPRALLKIDQCLDGVHFDLARHSLTQAGRKAVNRCLSDCAAMACEPAALLLAVTLPHGATAAMAQELFLACRDAAARFDCPLVGGDTAIWPQTEQRLAITVAALGRAAPGVTPVLRSEARVGDLLVVSGALGGSILGHHLDFEPRIELALAVTRAARISAMMDISDGLAQDLPRLCAASSVGARVDGALLPLTPAAHELATSDGKSSVFHGLCDGEDYELLLALAPEQWAKLAPAAAKERGGIRLAGVPLTVIGAVTSEPELVVVDAGQVRPWPRGGWEYQSG